MTKLQCIKNRNRIFISAVLAAMIVFQPFSVWASEPDYHTAVVPEYVCLTSIEGPSEQKRLQSFLDQSCRLEQDLWLMEVQPHLAGMNAELYDALFNRVSEVASAEEDNTVFDIPVDVSAFDKQEWTADDLGLDSLVEADGDSVKVAPATHEAMDKLLDYDGNRVVMTLVNRCMTQLYWFGLGYYCGYPYEVYYDGATYKVRLTGTVHVILSVSVDYAAYDPETGERVLYSVDPSKLSRVNTAIENAKSVVADAASLPDDRAKLKYYYETISDLSGYDFAAASGAPYGDPWQIINVFDDDPETMVVCEGYSKAFQYLCDQTTFDSPETKAYCVTGYQTWETASSLPDSTHMWNVVHMEDGNYLVDVTNGNKMSYLFLAPCVKGSLKEGYYIYLQTLNGKELHYRYIYEDSTRRIYTNDELRLAGDDHVYPEEPEEPDEPASISLTNVVLPENAFTYTGKEIKPDRLTVTAVVDGIEKELKEGTDYSVVYNNNTNAGTATVAVTGCGVYTGTLSADYTILPQKIQSVTLSQKNAVYTGKSLFVTQGMIVRAGDKQLDRSEYTVSYQNNQKVGAATVIVRGKGNYTGTIKKTFKILPKGTSVSSLKAAKNKLKIKWKKQAKQIDGYQIQYSTSKNFKRGSKTITVKNAGTTLRNVSGLKAKTTYYVKIRTFKNVSRNKYYSSWSGVKKIKTKSK